MTPLPPVLPLRLAKAATSLAWWLVVLGLAPEPAAAAVNLEAAALLTIRKGFTNGLEALPGWTDSRSSPCTWEGIGCDPDTGQVVEVLGGTLPPDFRFPSSLKYLYLLNNTFTGTIPAWELPEAVTELSLFNNRLSGPYPRDWVLPPGLLFLDLGYNQLTGTLDPAWVFPPTLQTLSLSYNQFRGTIPSNWTLADSLQLLYLHTNPLLTGTIPQDWVLPAALANFALGNCNFSGPLPTRLKLPSGLQALDVSNNSLTGTIPSNWALPESLQLEGTEYLWGPSSAARQTLVLFSNSLTGPIPANLILPSGLLTLKLSLNQLTGSISKDWKLPSTLQTLYLNDNQLTGTLDPAWELPESLFDFQIAYNNLSGLLPAWNLPNLKLADFRYCNFTGPLPAYPVQPTTTVAVMPQSGDGFCGEVPSSPPYYKNKPSLLTFTQRLGNSSLDSCPPDTPPPYTYPPAGSPPPQSPFPLPPTNPSPSPSPSPGNVTSGGGGGSSSTVGIAVGLAVGVVASGLEDDVESSPGQRCSPGKGGFEEAAEELSFSATDPANSGFRACTASTSSEAAQGDPVLAVALKTGVSDGSVAESAALQQGMSRQTLEMLALRMWIIDFDTLELQRQIGEGSFGRVYLATWQHTPVAVKILLNTALDVYSEEAVKQALTLSSPVLENLQKEAALMCSLRHPSIVTFLGVCPVPPCVVTEYCARGSLADVLRTARQSPAAAAKLDWLRRLNMMLDTAKGMLHLHSHSPAIIHRDLKSANLLVDTHWRCKVSDFNLSRILEDRVVLSSAMATNPRWLAPEVLEGQPATLQSDVYSFGVVLWEVLTWDVPFANDNHFQLIKHVAAGGRPPIPARQELPGREGGEAGGLDDYVALMRRCWAQAPEERPSFQYVVGIFKDRLLNMSKAVPKKPAKEEPKA
ncbi:hypothetical protein N2152v2_009616 [Parachlorella kessleri]